MTKRSKDIDLKVKQVRMSDVMEDIARFDKSHRTFDDKLVRAGRVVVLTVGAKTVRVIARGPSGVKQDEIALSSETRDRLGVKSGECAKFTFSKAGFLDDFLWAWNASDAMPRIAIRLGVISVGLGIVGVGLGVIALAL